VAEWFIKKITGQDLMDKAIDLAIAEENANLIINALRPELQDIEAAEITSREAEIASQRADELQREVLALKLEGQNLEVIEAAQRAADSAARAADLAREPVVIRAEGFAGTGGTAGGVRLLQSKRYELNDITVNGNRVFIDVEGIGRIVDVYIVHATSNSFNVELIIDGDKWYSDSYTNLTTTSVADSYLAAYQDAMTDYYVVKFSGISFIHGFKVVISANNLTFGVLRANYLLEVTY
jgi:hypothetical protein